MITVKEKEKLKAGVHLIDDCIIEYKISLAMSELELNVIKEHLSIFFTEKKDYFILIDLSESKLPNTEQKKVIKKFITPAYHYTKHMAVFTGKNMLINLMAKFILGSVLLNSISLHTTRQQALNTIYKKRNRNAVLID